MTTITFELPNHLTTSLESKEVSDKEGLGSFLARAAEAWINEQRGANLKQSAASWEKALETDAVDFVSKIVDDNRELFEELAKR